MASLTLSRAQFSWGDAYQVLSNGNVLVPSISSSDNATYFGAIYLFARNGTLLTALRDVSNGTISGAVGASYSEDRARFAVYPAKSNGQLDMTRSLEVSSYSLYRIKGAS